MAAEMRFVPPPGAVTSVSKGEGLSGQTHQVEIPVQRSSICLEFSPMRRRQQGRINHSVYRHLSMPCPVMRGCLRLIMEATAGATATVVGAGVRVAVGVGVSTAVGVGVAVELGRILVTGEGVGSSEHPGMSMARNIAPASSTLLAMDFDISHLSPNVVCLPGIIDAHDKACRSKSSPRQRKSYGANDKYDTWIGHLRHPPGGAVTPRAYVPQQATEPSPLTPQVCEWPASTEARETRPI